MKEQLEQRLSELKTEYQTGQNMLADLETKRSNLQQTLLRISGAMQVLEELLGSGSSPDLPAHPNPSPQVSEPNGKWS